MRASGVICEFNPFHNGHAYLLSHMRELVGEDGCVVCLMSGRFVQRGEASIADPYTRAETALSGGADLVLELPFPWSAGSAEHFAAAGVDILTRLGVDTLVFGSESGDLTLLTAAAEAVASPRFGEVYAELCRRGTGTTAAYAEALRTVCPVSLPEGFPDSNELLGVSYLRALHKAEATHGRAPVPHTVTRQGSGYREDTLTEGQYPSATALRALIREAACDPVALEAILDGTMPAGSLTALLRAVNREDAPLSNRPLLSFCHTLYRIKSPADFENCAEMSGGIVSHICRRARETATPEAFFAFLRTKQYTDARLRRALLFGALGVTDTDLRALPAYTTLLAANTKGCALLKELRKAHKDDPNGLTVVTKPADAPEGRQRELAELSDALFTLCYPAPRGAGEHMRKSPVIFNSEFGI
jgi:predicted nucleotidyltransferase